MLGVAFSSVDQDPPGEKDPPSPQGPPRGRQAKGQVQVFTEASRFHSRTCSIIKTSGV